MSHLASLRYKIAFIFFLVTAAAFTAIWFVVVPQLEQNLKERRLDSLQTEARDARAALEAPLLGGPPLDRGARARVAAAGEDRARAGRAGHHAAGDVGHVQLELLEGERA